MEEQLNKRVICLIETEEVGEEVSANTEEHFLSLPGVLFYPPWICTHPWYSMRINGVWVDWTPKRRYTNTIRELVVDGCSLSNISSISTLFPNLTKLKVVGVCALSKKEELSTSFHDLRTLKSLHHLTFENCEFTLFAFQMFFKQAEFVLQTFSFPNNPNAEGPGGIQDYYHVYKATANLPGQRGSEQPKKKRRTK
jgi:hypothetical protein